VHGPFDTFGAGEVPLTERRHPTDDATMFQAPAGVLTAGDVGNEPILGKGGEDLHGSAGMRSRSRRLDAYLDRKLAGRFPGKADCRDEDRGLGFLSSGLHRRQDTFSVAPHEADGAVDDELGRVDASLSQTSGVVPLPLSERGRRIRVFPAQPVPVVDVKGPGDELDARRKTSTPTA